MLFYFSGVGVMALIHWIMHRFESPTSTSPGIENTGAIQQFMQREAAGGYDSSSASLLPQFSTRTMPSNSGSTALHGHGHGHGHGRTRSGAGGPIGGAASSSSTVTPHPNHKCEACIQEDSDEEDEEGIDETEEERYNDSEYVDDEVTSLLNNAFLQIGKTPNSRMDDDTPHQHMRQHRNRNGIPAAYDDDEDHTEDNDGDGDDDQSIEVVITDQKDKILRRPQGRAAAVAADSSNSDLDLDLDLDLDIDDIEDGRPGLHGREKSWSAQQKPFAPVNKKKAAAATAAGGDGGHVGRKHKGRKRTKECHLDHTIDHKHNKNTASQQTPPSSGGSGRRFFRQYHHQQQPQQQQKQPTYGSMSSPNGVANSNTLPRSSEQQATHLRRTSFPRLKGVSSSSSNRMVYSTHDNLDHAIADDREHADLTEIGIQTALTIAIHKFPGEFPYFTYSFLSKHMYTFFFSFALNARECCLTTCFFSISFSRPHIIQRA